MMTENYQSKNRCPLSLWESLAAVFLFRLFSGKRGFQRVFRRRPWPDLIAVFKRFSGVLSAGFNVFSGISGIGLKCGFQCVFRRRSWSDLTAVFGAGFNAVSGRFRRGPPGSAECPAGNRSPFSGPRRWGRNRSSSPRGRPCKRPDRSSPCRSGRRG